MKNEKWDDVHGNTTPDDRMVAFLESPTDSYAILQLREDVDDNIPLMFANYSYLQKKEMEPEIDRYEVVYHIIDDDRRLNAERMEAAFYSGRQATPEPVQPAATESSADDKELLLKLLQNPEMAALLKSLAKTL